METKKIGAFLQSLRKEKKLTQEQLAERFHVSSRTVSRWETGANMPDISLLVELADFYSVDIREIIDGERKDGAMDEDVKSTAEKMAGYAEEEKKRLLRRIRIINAAGVVAGCLSAGLNYSALPEQLYFCRMLRDICAGFTVGVMISTLLYSTGLLAKAKAAVKRKRALKAVAYAALAILAMCLSAAAVLTWAK